MQKKSLTCRQKAILISGVVLVFVAVMLSIRAHHEVDAFSRAEPEATSSSQTQQPEGRLPVVDDGSGARSPKRSDPPQQGVAEPLTNRTRVSLPNWKVLSRFALDDESLGAPARSVPLLQENEDWTCLFVLDPARTAEIAPPKSRILHGRYVLVPASTDIEEIVASGAALELPVYGETGVEQMFTSSLVVRFADTVSVAEALRMSKAFGSVAARPLIPEKNLFLLEFGVDRIQTIPSLRTALHSRADVVYAEPNWVMVVRTTSADPLYANQWHLENTGQVLPDPVPGIIPDADIDAPEAWNITNGASDVVVAVLDDGVQTTHPDLVNSLSPSNTWYDAADGDSDPSPQPGRYHGTCIAGIIAATTDNGIGGGGVAPGVKIMPVRMTVAYTNESSTETAWAVDSIQWAVSNGASVINCSWAISDGGGALSDAIDHALQNGREGKGCVVVVSAGNENSTIRHFPAIYEPVLTVGASSPADERKSPGSVDGETHWGSDYGSHLDCVAPGVKICTTDLLGSDGHDPGDYTYRFAGTSASTPIAGGIAALLLSVDNNLTQEEVVSILRQSAERVGGYRYTSLRGDGYWDPEMGFGRLNAHRVLQARQGQDVQLPRIAHTPVGWQTNTGPFYVAADISDSSGLAGGSSQPTLFYRVDNGAWTSVNDTDGPSNAVYVFEIAPVPFESTVSYFFGACDVSAQSNSITYPLGGAFTNYSAYTPPPHPFTFGVSEQSGFYYVSPNGSNAPPYSTWETAATNIQDAIDLAELDRTVLIGDGTYLLPGELSVRKAITVRGANGPDAVFIDGRDSNRCLLIDDAGAIVRDITIRNGGGVTSGGGVYLTSGALRNCTVVSNNTSSLGGGITCESDGLIDNCIVSNNTAVTYGGGVHFVFGGTVRDSLVVGNSAKYAGGIHCGNGGEIDSCEVFANSATKSGGGVLCNDGGTVENSQVIGNSAVSGRPADGGGGVYVSLSGSITDSLIASNTVAGHRGGGIHCNGGGLVERCDITKNTAYLGSGAYCNQGGTIRECRIYDNNYAETWGGGVCLNQGGGLLQNSLVTGNSVGWKGGGVYVGSGSVVENCTVADNSCYWWGGGIYCQSGGTIRNTISYFNSAPHGANYDNDGGGSYTYCCTTPARAGTGNTAEAPGLVDRIGGDYRLTPASPCVDSGMDMPALTNDLDGVSRPQDGNGNGDNRWDMGAYERPGASDFSCSFAASPSSGTGPLAAVFQPQVDGQPASSCHFSWDFDNDGEVDSAGMNLVVQTNVFWTNGSYSAALLVSNTLGETALAIRSNLVSVSSPVFSGTPLAGDAPLPVVFSAQDPGIAGNLFFAWDFDGDSHIDFSGLDARVVTNTYWTPGTYTVGLTISNAVGDYTSPALLSDYISVESMDDIHYVSPTGLHRFPYTTWPDAATNIHDATDVAENGDTVLIDDGAYILTSPVEIDKAITVRSRSGATSTVLDGGNQVRCLHLNAIGAVAEGFTIRNGRAGNAGGVHCQAGVLRKCTVTGCTATQFNPLSAGGGGVCFGTDSSAVVEDCEIMGNSTLNCSGGGVAFRRGGTIRRCYIHGNSTLYDGGGIMFYGSGLAENCLVVSNTASRWGGGVSMYCSLNYGMGTMRNCTVVDNNTGLYTYSNGGGTVVNSIIVSNGTSNIYGSSTRRSVSYSCTAGEVTGSGNITADPLFMGSGDYRLSLNSPCIDAATASGAPSVDIVLVPRPLDGDASTSAQYDMGAYESAHPGVDTDGDGMPDGWEAEFGLDLLSDDSASDPDDDSMPNHHEWIADTIPTNGDSCLRIDAVSVSNGILFVQWRGGATATQTLERCDDLTSPAPQWQAVLTNHPPTPTVATGTDNLGVGRQSYYRIRASR